MCGCLNLFSLTFRALLRKQIMLIPAGKMMMFVLISHICSYTTVPAVGVRISFHLFFLKISESVVLHLTCTYLNLFSFTFRGLGRYHTLWEYYASFYLCTSSVIGGPRLSEAETNTYLGGFLNINEKVVS